MLAFQTFKKGRDSACTFMLSVAKGACADAHAIPQVLIRKAQLTHLCDGGCDKCACVLVQVCGQWPAAQSEQLNTRTEPI